MSEFEIITATEASRSFSDVLHRVCYKGESFVIKKGNRMMARIVPVDEAEIAPRPEVKTKKAAVKTEAPPLEIIEKKKEKSLEKSVEKIVVTTPAPKTSGGLSVPEGLTQEDVDFYQNLIANLGANR
jgi:antitoxin (DNA-binding transcriptional repressor) of toxin-antitoxin stability system